MRGDYVSRRNRNNKPPKQGHKILLFTLAVILVPTSFVGYTLLTSIDGQGKPVAGERFSKDDLNPFIEKKDIKALEESLNSLESVEKASVDMPSATLRVHLDLTDDASEETAQKALDNAYNVVNNLLPVDVYFTNKEGSKMYDLEIDSYNYLIDDVHTTNGWVYLKLTKTGSAKKPTIDNMNKPRDEELSNKLKAASDKIQQNIANMSEQSSNN